MVRFEQNILDPILELLQYPTITYTAKIIAQHGEHIVKIVYQYGIEVNLPILQLFQIITNQFIKVKGQKYVFFLKILRVNSIMAFAITSQNFI